MVGTLFYLGDLSDLLPAHMFLLSMEVLPFLPVRLIFCAYPAQLGCFLVLGLSNELRHLVILTSYASLKMRSRFWNHDIIENAR